LLEVMEVCKKNKKTVKRYKPFQFPVGKTKGTLLYAPGFLASVMALTTLWPLKFKNGDSIKAVTSFENWEGR